MLIEYKNVDIYQDEMPVLCNVDFSIVRGEYVYLLGKVGSGKSTFMKTLYAEVPIRSGEARIFDYDLSQIKRKHVPFLRRKIGVVFQDFQLMSDRSVEQNLEFVLRATGWKDKKKIAEQIELVLSIVGLAKKGYKRPHQLSGGEQQRVVIARALLNSPEVIVADEPSGNLDPETANEIFSLLYDISRGGTSVIIATHNHSFLNVYPGRIFVCNDEHLTEKSVESLN